MRVDNLKAYVLPDAVVFTASPHSLLEDARSQSFEKDLGWAPSLDARASFARTPLA